MSEHMSIRCNAHGTQSSNSLSYLVKTTHYSTTKSLNQIKAAFFIAAQIAQVALPVIFKWTKWAICAEIKKCSLNCGAGGLLDVDHSLENRGL